MARPKVTPKNEYRDGFDVTAVIGHVTFGDGDERPEVAAYRLIGEHNAPGVYMFPGESADIVVTVDWNNRDWGAQETDPSF